MNLTHKELYQAVINGTLPVAEFDHEAHIRLAWYYLTRWPFSEASRRFHQDFRKLVQSAGAEAKYHKTITTALLQLIASHLGDEKCRSDWASFKADAEPLFADAVGLLQRFYSPTLLNSDTARTTLATPDLCELPGISQPWLK